MEVRASVLTCPVCDGEVVRVAAKGAPRKYCSIECRLAARAERAKGWSRPAQPRKKQNSSPEELASRRSTCVNCGSPIRRRANAKYCNADECRRINDNEKMREYFRRLGGNKHNTPERARAYYEKRRADGWREEWTPAKRASSDRRRAAKKGVGSEVFSHLEVYERDGWVCGICSEPVDASLAWPDPFSPSLDHVMPLSLGGNHTRANTRLSHLRCNVARGNRIEQEDAAA